jgi:hypothetical protein
MNSCLSCGSDNAEDVRFCVKCGKRLEFPQPPPEFWRYNTEDLNPPRPVQPIPQPPPYRQPPPYANQPPPQQGYDPRQGYASQQEFGRQQTARPYAPPAPYQPPYPPAPLMQAATSETSLPRVGMTLGIVVACIAVVGLIPCLGWLNWFALILGKAALIICIIALASDKDASRRSMALMGLILASVTIVVAIIRLFIGGGCL